MQRMRHATRHGVLLYLLVLSAARVVGASTFPVQLDVPQEETLASVSGIVTHTINRTPMADVRVEFRVDNAAAEAGNWIFERTSTGAEQFVARTDTDGRFTAEVPPARYRLVVSETGFFQLGGPRTLTLNAGAELTGIQFSLTPGSAITGRVVDAEGDAVVGAIVTAFAPKYTNGRRLISPCDVGSVEGAQQETDERGEYRLFGMEPGSYYVAAEQPLGRPQNSCAFPSYYPGVIDPADALPITVLPNSEASGVLVPLTEATFYPVTFGVVAPPDGSYPRPNLLIVRRSRQESIRTSTIWLSGAEYVSVDREQNGTVRVRFSLPPGSYDAHYRSSLSGSSIGRLSFDVTDRAVNAGTMVLAPAVLMPGRIRMASGVEMSKPFESLIVMMKPIEDWPYSMSLFYSGPSWPQADGSFLAATGAYVSEGRYRINLFGLPPDQFIAAIRYGNQDVTALGYLEVSASSPDRMVEIVVDEPAASVGGIVRNRSDEPVADALVVLIPSENRRQNLELYRTVYTDQLGRFSIAGLPPGDYAVIAWEDVPDGAWRNADFMRPFSTRLERIHLEKGDRETLDLTLVPR